MLKFLLRRNPHWVSCLHFYELIDRKYHNYFFLFLGFYDTSNEEFVAPKPRFGSLRQHELDEKRRDEEEQKNRKKDKDKLKSRKENDIPSAMLNNDEPAKKRSKLVLPEPQIGTYIVHTFKLLMN